MIRLICFDLDGVLVDACEIHRVALNKALTYLGLPEISMEDHISKFNGLPTKAKLRHLGYDEKSVDVINSTKQKMTMEAIMEGIGYDYDKQALLFYLKEYFPYLKLACVTNSIRKTTLCMLKNADIDYLFDLIITNEDVVNPKPSPEGYLKAMNTFEVYPSETLIIEDSDFGYKAAIDSGAKVLRVKDPSEVTPNRIIPCL